MTFLITANDVQSVLTYPLSLKTVEAAGKQELETALTKSCKIVIDEWQQASHSGEINVSVSRAD